MDIITTTFYDSLGAHEASYTVILLKVCLYYPVFFYYNLKYFGGRPELVNCYLLYLSDFLVIFFFSHGYLFV